MVLDISKQESLAVIGTRSIGVGSECPKYEL